MGEEPWKNYRRDHKLYMDSGRNEYDVQYWCWDQLSFECKSFLTCFFRDVQAI